MASRAQNTYNNSEQPRSQSSVSYTPVEHPAPNPHGAVTFGKLTSMKIKDRSSVYVAGIKKCNASRIILSKYENFGQFGAISSLRIIQKTNPAEVYLRYVRPEAASRAIEWCRNRGLDADHGYHKYCIKFINNKTCKRLNCPNRHSWCYEQNDIMTKYKLEPASTPQPINAQPLCFPKSTGRADIALNFPMDDSENTHKCSPIDVDPLKTLQAQFLRLQQQYTAQNEFIKNLMISHRKLKDENQRLLRQRVVNRQPVELTSITEPILLSPSEMSSYPSAYQPMTPSSMETDTESPIRISSTPPSSLHEFNPNAATFCPQPPLRECVPVMAPKAGNEEQLSCTQIVDALILGDCGSGY